MEVSLILDPVLGVTLEGVVREAFSLKFIILYLLIALFIGCAVYTHFRGKVRHRFARQLSDHSTFMGPINCFMYAFSKVKNEPYAKLEEFPELKQFRDNWETIRAEALALASEGQIKASEKYDDAGFNSFFRQGWKRFYLKWYGDYHESAKKYCPKTIEMIESVPGIKAAMFTQLAPGSTLVKHRDPYAGSLRYHLGIITPNDDQCAIDVDGTEYSWRDGEDVLFDETYIHYAYNKTDKDRIIFFCDVERPMRGKFAQWVNHAVGNVFLAAAAAPNSDSDRTGFINKAFKYIYAVRRVGKRMKAWNRRVYYLVKWVLFGGIAALLILLYIKLF